MSDDPFGTFFGILKWAVGPFAAIGGWAGIRYLIDKYFDQQRHSRDSAQQEREKVMSSLDARAAAYMDRLEREIKSVQENFDRAETGYRKRVEDLQSELDEMWTVAAELERLLHLNRHAHIAAIQKSENMLYHCQRCVDGTLSPEGRAAIQNWQREQEPARIPDMRELVKIARETRPRP